MLVAAHGLEVVLLWLVPVFAILLLARRVGVPARVAGVGVLVYFFAEAILMGLAPLVRVTLGAVGVAPGRDLRPLLDAIVAGMATALVVEGIRVHALHRWLPNSPPTRREAAMLGLGLGAAHAFVAGAMVLLMAALAIVLEGKSFEEVRDIGLEGGAAVKIGLKVFAWWEGDPSAALLSGLRELSWASFQVALSVAWAWLLTSSGGPFARGLRATGIVAVHALLVFGVVYGRGPGAAFGSGDVAAVVAGVAGVGALALVWVPASRRAAPDDEPDRSLLADSAETDPSRSATNSANAANKAL